MPNEIIRNDFIGRVDNALRKAKNVAAIDHAGLRGKAREIFVQDILRPVLPPYAEFGSGKIVDSEGGMSAETDVVIYSRQTLPSILFDSECGLYPVEGAVYAIEVKSKINATELKSTIEKFKRLRELTYLPTIVDYYGEPREVQCPPVIPCLFAFESDLSEDGKSELERYREYDQYANEQPVIPVFCISGRGYWWFNPHEPNTPWMKHQANEEHEDIIDFIGGIANTIPDQVVAKGRPRFGNYILRDKTFIKE